MRAAHGHGRSGRDQATDGAHAGQTGGRAGGATAAAPRPAEGRADARPEAAPPAKPSTLAAFGLARITPDMPADEARSMRRKRIATVAFAVVVVAFFACLVVLNAGIERVPLRPTGGSQFAKATVTEVLQSDVETSDTGEMQGNQTVMLRVTSGEFEGQEVQATSPYANNSGAYCTPGLKVIALVNQGGDGNLVATVYNYDRGLVLWVLVALFLCLICVAGGRSGALSALGLVFTFACIFLFYLPLVYIGASPFWVAVATVVLVTVVGMFLIGGWTAKTLCSIVGTVGGVLVAGIVASAFGHFGNISGLNVSDIETLAYIGQNSRLDVSGLLFSSILISALGAVMDVSMSVASTVSELHATDPTLGVGRLFRSGMAVGRDMMGTMTHTLILAFAGTSINMLVIIYAYSMPYLEFMNRYDIGIEILRGLSGSLGIILAVPLVSLAAALLMGRRGAGKGTGKVKAPAAR